MKKKSIAQRLMGLGEYKLASDFSEIAHEQYYGDGEHSYRVADLRKVVQKLKLPAKQIKISDLEQDLSELSADEPVGSKEFIERANKADLSFPIIVVRYKNDELHIADGAHRTWKSKQLGNSYVYGFIIDYFRLPPPIEEENEL